MRARLQQRLFCSTISLLALVAATAASLAEVTPQASEEAEATRTLIGSYLAGRFARNQNETASAADFYHNALIHDPGNEVLLEQTFIMDLTQGNWPRATQFAESLVAKQPSNRVAQTFLGLVDFKAGAYGKAEEHFKSAGEGPIGELTAALAKAWNELALGETDAAMALLDEPKQAEWAQFYLRYHRGLIADLGGKKSEARASLERVFKQDPRTLRTTLAYAQHAANSGDAKLAKSIIKEHFDRNQGEGHPLARQLRDQISSGVQIPLLITTPEDGMAEVFYGLGEALTGEGGIALGLPYLQMALFMNPDHAFALAALANTFEATKNYDHAIAIYDRIPKGSPLQSAIDIRKAFNLNSLDRVDEAKALLEEVARQDPTDLKPLDALGSIMRARKRYDEAIEYYTRAIALISAPDKRHWNYYYARGTCYERVKKWSLAEADLQKALSLYPDQALVLNYLGYSWVDQNLNMKQGMALIEKAVALKPDDGYIVDSLGWAHFKLGNFKDAARYLERAVELKPDDPTLNDHLGDALWRVGREREARFQWDQALSLKPEPEDVEKIQKKITAGLPAAVPPRGLIKTKDARRGGEVRKRVQTQFVPTRPVVR